MTHVLLVRIGCWYLATATFGSVSALSPYIRMVKLDYRAEAEPKTVQGLFVPIIQGLFVPFARVGSGDPVRVLRLFHNKYTGYT